MVNNFSILNKIECVDLCSKCFVVAVKIFENENEKIGFLYLEEREKYKQKNKMLFILFSLLNFNKAFGICCDLLETPNNRSHLFFSR